MTNSWNALTSGSAVRYGSELCKPTLASRDGNTLQNTSRHGLPGPTNSDVGQLGAEVVKSCMKKSDRNRVLLNVCSLHVIPLSTVPVWFSFALPIQSPDLTLPFLRSSIKGNWGKIQACSLHSPVASLPSRKTRVSHSLFPAFLAVPAEMLTARLESCKELFSPSILPIPFWPHCWEAFGMAACIIYRCMCILF